MTKAQIIRQTATALGPDIPPSAIYRHLRAQGVRVGRSQVFAVLRGYGYLPADKLAALIRQAHVEGEIGPDLIRWVRRIARQVWAGFKGWTGRPAWEDARQSLYLRFLQVLERIDLDGNPREYLTAVFASEVKLLARRERNHLRKLRGLAEEMGATCAE